jgi:hypothetical protein
MEVNVPFSSLFSILQPFILTLIKDIILIEYNTLKR